MFYNHNHCVCVADRSKHLVNDVLFLCIANKRRKDVIALLKQRGYPSDPVKAWKESVSKDHVESDNEDSSSTETPDDQGMDYDYLVGLSGWYLTLEKKEELLKQRDARVGHIISVQLFIQTYLIVG